MNVYLAAAYTRREEMQRYARLIKNIGQTVTSRWLIDSSIAADNGKDCPADDVAEMAARIDIMDIIAADIVISFTEPLGGSGRGGRHVEFGIGLALRKRLWLVGRNEHIFHCLEKVERFNDFAEAVTTLAREAMTPPERGADYWMW